MDLGRTVSTGLSPGGEGARAKSKLVSMGPRQRGRGSTRNVDVGDIVGVLPGTNEYLAEDSDTARLVFPGGGVLVFSED